MNLILLIGTNPLPNYVVGKYFLKNKKIQKVFLVHSLLEGRQQSTLFYAQQIAKLLRNEFSNIDFQINGFGVDDVSNPASIAKVMGKIISECEDNLHLDYTGGTKTMGVHSFDILKNAKVSFSYSYLDARNFQIVINDNQRPEADLRTLIKISFPQLIELHGYVRSNQDGEFLFGNAIAKFKEIINNGTIDNFFSKEGYERRLFLNAKNEVAEKIGQIRDNNKKALGVFKPNDTFNEINYALPEDHKLFINNTFNENLNNRQFKAIVREFLDGKWLEQYVFEELKDSDFVNNKNFELLTNWEIKKPKWTGNKKFEIDVLLLNGYQLCGISCTTSDKRHLCKSKGFEIFLRTKQIGGDEAKAIIITRANSELVKELQSELQYDTGSPEGGLLVIGKEDWETKKLAASIKKFINS